MKNLINLNQATRSRITSIALLCLFAHAFFVSVTHHHAPIQARFFSDVASITDNSGETNSTPESASDAHCLSCRLQRDFGSSLHSSSVLIQPLKEPVSRETLGYIAAFTGSSIVLFGRAPPLA